MPEQISRRPLSRLFGFLIALLLLMLSALACQHTSLVKQPTSPAESVLPTPAAAASATPSLPGLSRVNPMPGTEPASLTNWEVHVLETVRGDDAWQMIQVANQSNEPPAPGEEYLLLRMRVRNKRVDEEKNSIGLHVTGNSLVLHFGFDAGVVEPEPWLETHLAGGAESEGWNAYRIRQDEGNLMLVIEDYFNLDEPTRYLALDEGASIETPIEALHSIKPTELGTEPAQPLPLGQIATSEDWQLRVREVVIGQEAWQMIIDANQFNDPPAEGMKYVLARVWVRYIGLQESGKNISGYSFTAGFGVETEYERPVVVEPEPELYAYLFPGGEAEGWVALQAPASQDELLLIFSPSFAGTEINRRYLSLVQFGR
jgi:hypothetical protein